MHFLTFIRRRPGPISAGLTLLLVLLLWLSPVEQTLGQTVKLVYLHGALVRTAMVLFALSLPVNLVALVTAKENWLAWGRALTWAGIIIWLAHTLFSMVTTYAAWGVFIAWSEPRTRFTFNLAAVGLIIVVGSYLVASPRLSALIFVILAGVVWGFLPGMGFIQHPLDPIGASPSSAIRLFYAAILLVTFALAGLLVIWLQGRFTSQQPDSP